MTCVQYSPDGKLILSCGGDDMLKLWGDEKGDEVRIFAGHKRQ